jgi:hypothetical protein
LLTFSYSNNTIYIEKWYYDTIILHNAYTKHNLWTMKEKIYPLYTILIIKLSLCKYCIKILYLISFLIYIIDKKSSHLSFTFYSHFHFSNFLPFQFFIIQTNHKSLFIYNIFKDQNNTTVIMEEHYLRQNNWERIHVLKSNSDTMC